MTVGEDVLVRHQWHDNGHDKSLECLGSDEDQCKPHPVQEVLVPIGDTHSDGGAAEAIPVLYGWKVSLK